MIKAGDKVKVIKINSFGIAELVGREGVVLAVDESNLYKYRVEIDDIGMVYGFVHGEIEKIGESEADPTITIRDIALDIAELVEKKNHDYNHSFDKTLKEYGDAAYFLRIEDKLSRLKSLSKKEAKVNESIEDTLKDIIGYTLLMLKSKLDG